MRRLSPIAVVVLVAFSVPVAVELRTFVGFFGVDLSTNAVIVFETVVVALIFGAYLAGELWGDDEPSTAE